MKLIKLLYDFNTPLKETVTSFFPRDIEETLKSNYILVSDAKFRLLQFAKVGMYVYSEYSETEVHNMDNFLKDEYYIVKEVIEPKNVDLDDFDLSTYELGDIVFFHKDAPVAPVKPQDPRLHSGTFNYELSDKDKKLLLDKYKEDLTKYEEDLATYEEEYNTFMEENGDLPIFNAVGIVAKKEEILDIDFPVKVYGDKKLYIAFSAKFETTKVVFQFGVEGKLPKEMGTLVTNDVGGIKAGTSIKGKSLKEIITKAFGLEVEKDPVGTYQPDDDAKGMSKPSVNYGALGKTSLGGPNDTATISTTLELPEDTEATTVKLINNKTGEVVESKAISTPTDEVSFDVTGLSKTTSFVIKAVHTVTDPESGETEEVVDGKSSVTTVVVKIVAPKVVLSSDITSGNTHTPITFTAAVTVGSSTITSVELYKITEETTKVADMTLTEGNYTYTLATGINADTRFFAVVKDQNFDTGVDSNTLTITLNVNKPTVTATVTPTTITTSSATVTINATATKGDAELSEISVNDGTTTKTETPAADGTATITFENVHADTLYTVKAVDIDGYESDVVRLNVAYNYIHPVVTVDSVTVTSSDGDKYYPSSTVTVVVNSTAQTGATGGSVVLYKDSIDNANIIATESTYAASTTFTLTNKFTVGSNKIIAVVNYSVDDEPGSAYISNTDKFQTINVETPPTFIYWGNFLTINGDEPGEDVPDATIDDVTTENVTTFISKSATNKIPSGKMTKAQMFYTCPGVVYQHCVIVPTNAGTVTIIDEDGADVTTGSYPITKTLTIDGTEYKFYMVDTAMFDASGTCKMFLTIS